MAALSQGVLALDIAGTIFEVEGSFSCQSSNVMREAKVSQSGRVHYIVTPVAPMFSGTVLVTDGTELRAIYIALTDGTCQVTLRDGTRYVYSGCFSKGEWPHNVIDGTAEIEVTGSECEVL